MVLHRHRVITLFNRDKPTDWSVWYSKPQAAGKPHIEVESKEFADDQVKRIGSSKTLGSLYKEKINYEHIRY